MKKQLTSAALLAALGLGLGEAVESAQVVNPVFAEDFESLTLGDSINERISTIPTFDLSERKADDPDFSPIPNSIASAPPAGWSVDNNFNAFGNFDLNYDPTAKGDPAVLDIDEGIVPPVGLVLGNTGLLNAGSFEHGVDEWEGWRVAEKDFWVEVAEDQDRSKFTLGMGNVAIADPDEYDDLGDGRGGGYYNTGLSTPFIPIPAGETDLQLNFDSSFRPEGFDDEFTLVGSSLEGQSLNNQTAVVYATFDGPNGATLTVPGTVMDSDSGKGMVGDADYRAASPTYRDSSLTINESISVLLPSIPAGAANVQLTFGLLNSANDWWWAIDNINVQGAVSGQIFAEDFEGVTLVDSINEQIADAPSFAHRTVPSAEPDTVARPDSFTKTAPAGWSVNDSSMPFPVADDDIGVSEFEGWNFMNLDFWTFADTQRRQEFTNASGNFAVADGDEWDDLGNPDGRTDPPVGGLMNTLLESPVIDISSISEGELYLQFDSSWRDEDANTAVITADFGNGPVEVLRWESDDTSAFLHDDNPNEMVLIPLHNPAGADTVKLAFQYIGGDDWWWAIDNIAVGTAVPEPGAITILLLGVAGFATAFGRKR